MKINQKPSWWDISVRVLTRAGLLSVVIIFVALNFTTYRLAHSYMHPPRVAATGEMLRANGITFETISLTTEDEITLRAFYTPSKNGAVILVAHGHGGIIPEDMVLLFAQHGYGVLAWDFRAHGASGGNFTSIGYYEVLDMKAALDFAKQALCLLDECGGEGPEFPQRDYFVCFKVFDALLECFPVRNRLA